MIVDLFLNVRKFSTISCFKSSLDLFFFHELFLLSIPLSIYSFVGLNTFRLLVYLCPSYLSISLMPFPSLVLIHMLLRRVFMLLVRRCSLPFPQVYYTILEVLERGFLDFFLRTAARLLHLVRKQVERHVRLHQLYLLLVSHVFAHGVVVDFPNSSNHSFL